jgi:hypothetical protein
MPRSARWWWLRGARATVARSLLLFRPIFRERSNNCTSHGSQEAMAGLSTKVGTSNTSADSTEEPSVPLDGSIRSRPSSIRHWLGTVFYQLRLGARMPHMLTPHTQRPGPGAGSTGLRFLPENRSWRIDHVDMGTTLCGRRNG